MRDKCLSFMIMMQLRMMGMLNDLKKEERGASDIVAIVLVMVIIIAVASIFKTQLTAAMNKVMDRLIEFVG